MRLEGGTMVGRYQVLDRIGAGGMGEVYRARDTRLDRIVAIKTIAAGFAHDVTASPRFERERRVTTSLEHPHICRLLDTVSQDGVEYLVMEFLEGESLAARTARGPMRLPKAIGCAIEIAEGLAYAHRRGVVHRDVKPGNIFLTPTGVKVLDFGLATMRQAGGAASVVDPADTAPAATRAGALVGTTVYMAPERLEGRAADARTDIFGFGEVLYEMLTGRRAFDGASTAGLVAAILTADPPAMNLAGHQGPEIEWITRKCLAKKPDDRWQSMADVAAVLRRTAGATAPREPTAAARPARWIAALSGAAVLALAAVFVYANRPAAVASGPPRTTTFTVDVPAGAAFTPTEGSLQTAQLAVSPSGDAIAFVATAQGASQIWIRRLDAVQAHPVPGTTEASYPFWSPDGQSLGFFARGFLRRVDLAGGPARSIADAPGGRGGTWNRAGTILFGRDTVGAIYRVSADGGAAVEQTHLGASRGETSHRWPQFLPDGNNFLYFARSPNEAYEGVYLGSLDSGEGSFLVNSNGGGVWAPPDRILYTVENTLLMRGLDVRRRQATGAPRPIAERVGVSSNFYTAVSVSTTGVLAYANLGSASELVWFDRQGARIGTALDRGGYVDFDISADGRSGAVAEIDPASDRPDIYVVDFARRTRQRLTSARETDASPIWSPDGSRVIFRSNRERVHDLYTRGVRDSAPERLFLKSQIAKDPTSWSPDGRLVLFHAYAAKSHLDVWAAPVDAPEQAKALIQTAANEMQAQISPDGRLVAYTSDESKTPQVYIMTLDGSARWTASTAGGFDPKWKPSGGELYYLAPDGWLMSVAVRASGAAMTEEPRPLFHAVEPSLRAPYTSVFDVAPDGSRFLVRVPLEDIRTLPLKVLLDWHRSP